MLQRPGYLANREVGKLDDYIGGLGIAQPPRISIKDDRFTLLDETGMSLADAALSIDVVIISVNKNASRIFYEKKVDQYGNKVYDPNNHDAPLCWSDNGVGPSKACSVPQAPTCGACPNAVWGSDVGLGGKPIPACGTIKKVAVLVSGHDGVFLLTVPPGSLGSFKQYIGTLAKMPASPEEIITRIKMENKELLFDTADWVPESYISYIETTIKNDDAATIVNRHDEARDPNAFVALPQYQGTQQAQPQPVQYQGVANTPPNVQPAPAVARRPPGRPPRNQQAIAAPPQGQPLQPIYAPPPQQQQPIYAPQPQQQPAFALPPQQQYAPPPQQHAPMQQQPQQGEILPPQQPSGFASGPVPGRPNGGAPAGFGFGMQQQPGAPDSNVTNMLSSAFNLPRRT
jgi:hypothetical protein